jgi:hypothetical protein
MDDRGQVSFFDEDEPGVEPITFANPMEESANRYWRASQIWRDKQESTWTTGDMIQELRGLYCYRGLAPILAERLMEDVIHDRRVHLQQSTCANDTIPMTNNSGQ